MRESIEVSEQKASQIFTDILNKTIKKELNWSLLTVAYRTDYDRDNLYIYKGEKIVAVMIASKKTEIYFTISHEDFVKFYRLMSKKKLNEKYSELSND